MPAYSKSCDYCGETIKMVRTRNGWLPFEEHSYGSVHSCALTRRSFRAPVPSLPPTLDRCGTPSTRETPCWWCSAPVFYHTNGNGDSVLFDELGPPWPVHPCWEEHRASRADRVRQYLLHQPNGPSGNPAGPSGKPAVPRPAWPEGLTQLGVTEETKYRPIFAIGHVYWSGYLDGVSQPALHLSSDLHDWDGLHVVGMDGIGYPVWMPSSRAVKYRRDDLGAFVCRLVQWDSKWYLVALRATFFRFGHPPWAERLVHVGRTLRCQYCGDSQDDQEAVWGFDESLRPECKGCFDFRNGRDPETFRELCSKVSMHGRM